MSLLMEKFAKLKDTVDLYSHQEEAINATGNRSLYAHATGAGKTITGIAKFEQMKADGSAKKALVIVPSGLRDNFADDGVSKFTDGKVNKIGTKEETRKGLAGDVDPDADYNVVSYAMFRKNPEYYLERSGADTVITDESHRGRNEKTMTLESLKSPMFRSQVKNYIGLTGSVTNNSPADIVPLIAVASGGAVDLGGSKSAFMDRYVKRSDNPMYSDLKEKRRPIVGFNHRRELIDKLKPYVHYMDHGDVKDIADFPDKHTETIKVPISREQAKLYKQLVQQDPKMDKMIRNKRYNTLNNDEAARAYNRLIEMRKLMNDPSSVIGEKANTETSPKVDKMISDLQNHLKETPDGKALLFSHLINGGIGTLEDELDERGIEYGEFIGKGNKGITEASRQQDIQDYKNNKKRVMLISSAGSEGLSLGNTTFEGVLDPHYNPERMQQMEARGVRSGGLKHRDQKDRVVNVNRYVATMPKTLGIFKSQYDTPDEIIYGIAEGKAEQNKVMHKLLKDVRRVQQGKRIGLGGKVDDFKANLFGEKTASIINKGEFARFDGSQYQAIVTDKDIAVLAPASRTGDGITTEMHDMAVISNGDEFKDTLKDFEVIGEEKVAGLKELLKSKAGQPMLHLSPENLDGKTLSPRIPDNKMTRDGKENDTDARISFAPSINKALNGIGFDMSMQGNPEDIPEVNAKEYYIHEPVNYMNVRTKRVTKKDVPDYPITKEVWGVNDIELKNTGKIKVTSVDSPKTGPIERLKAMILADGQGAANYRFEKVASTAWKRNMMNLSNDAVNELKGNKVLKSSDDYRKGLEVGTDNIVKKLGINESVKTKDLRNFVKNSLNLEKKEGRQYVKELKAKKNYSLPNFVSGESDGYGVAHIVGSKDLTKSKTKQIKGIKKDIKKELENDKNADVNFLEEAKNELESFKSLSKNMSKSEKNHLDAIIRRHEIDEIASAKRSLERGNITPHNKSFFMKERIMSHISPDVVFKESRNVAFANKNVKDYMKKIREFSDEVAPNGDLYLVGKSPYSPFGVHGLPGHKYGEAGTFDKARSNHMRKGLVNNDFNKEYIQTKNASDHNAKYYVDFDDVIVDCQPTVLKYLNGLGKYPKHTFKDVTEWNWYNKVYDKKDIEAGFKYAAQNIKLIPGARGALKRLADAKDTFILSATHEANRAYKRDWIRENLGFIADDHIIFDTDKSKYSGGTLIDDSADNIDDYKGDTYMVSKPHNLSRQDDSQAYLVDNLGEAVDEILKEKVAFDFEAPLLKIASDEDSKIVTKDQLHEVARIVHEVNRHYNKLLMEREDPSWDELDDKDVDNRITLLSETIPDVKKISAKKMHDMWVAQQAKEGWTYGESYDSKKKTHPCIVTWAKLPDLEKAKDAMYLAVIKAMTELHFGVDKLMTDKIKEVKVPGGDKVLMNKTAGIHGLVMEKIAYNLNELAISAVPAIGGTILANTTLDGSEKKRYNMYTGGGAVAGGIATAGSVAGASLGANVGQASFLVDKLIRKHKEKLPSNNNQSTRYENIEDDPEYQELLKLEREEARQEGRLDEWEKRVSLHRTKRDSFQKEASEDFKIKVKDVVEDRIIPGAKTYATGSLPGSLIGTMVGKKHIHPKHVAIPLPGKLNKANDIINGWGGAVIGNFLGGMAGGASQRSIMLTKEFRDRLGRNPNAGEYAESVGKGLIPYIGGGLGTPETMVEKVAGMSAGEYRSLLKSQFSEIQRQTAKQRELAEAIEAANNTLPGKLRDLLGTRPSKSVSAMKNIADESKALSMDAGQKYKVTMKDMIRDKLASFKEDHAIQKKSKFLPEIEKALATDTEKKVAQMMATSHEYKTPAVDESLALVQNYKWEATEMPLSKLQGINKPVKQDKVDDMAKTIEKSKHVEPFIVVNKIHGIKPQTYGKKILLDGHHRMHACEAIGMKTVPVYVGTFTGKAQLTKEVLREEVPNEKTAAEEYGVRNTGHIDKIRSSADSSRMVKIKYKDSAGKITERTVEPYKLDKNTNDFWAFDPAKDSIRRFKIKNIKALKSTNQSYSKRWPTETNIPMEVEKMENVEKVAGINALVMEKLAESNVVQDFVAGLDPTGVSTFRNSLGNQENHGVHKAVGDLGGFVGGAAAGAAVPAAALAGIGLALKGKNPGLAKDMRTMSRGSMDAYNPAQIKRYITSFGKLNKWKDLSGKVMTGSDKLMKDVEGAVGDVKKNNGEFSILKAIKKVKGDEGKRLLGDYKTVSKNKDAFEAIGDDLQKNHYRTGPDENIGDGISRSLTALTSLGTAGMTGGLNAASAHMQYNTAQDERRKKMENRLEKRAGIKALVRNTAAERNAVGIDGSGKPYLKS